MIERQQRLRIGLQKSGRLAEDSLRLLEDCGVAFNRSKDKLFWYGRNLPIDVLFLRDDDIPELLADGQCDLGIVGQNVAREYAGDDAPYTQLKALDFGHCRLSLAVPESADFASVKDLDGLRIATSYPALTAQFLRRNQVSAKIVKLSGSVEIAPSLGTADAISDLVSTGSTLRANHLREVEEILRSQSALYQRVGELPPAVADTCDMLLTRLDGVMAAQESKYVMLHAPRAALEQVSELLPGAEKPTILPLDGDPSRVVVHAVCLEAVFWEHLEALKAAGASAVLVLPVEKMLS